MRRVKEFFKVSLKDVDPSVELMQDSVERVFQSLTSTEILSGNLITGVNLDTTAQRIEHKLGRKAIGYIVTSRNAAHHVFKIDGDKLPTRFMTLAASGAVKVDIWFF